MYQYARQGISYLSTVPEGTECLDDDDAIDAIDDDDEIRDNLEKRVAFWEARKKPYKQQDKDKGVDVDDPIYKPYNSRMTEGQWLLSIGCELCYS